MTQAYPLQWPAARPRSKARGESAFRVDPTRAFEEMAKELAMMDVKGVVVSSNIPLRMDGTPYRDGLREKMADPGIAVYFTRKGRAICFACDTYSRPWENCRAIAKAIESIRAMERHGAMQIVDQMFEGFTALPAPGADAGTGSRAWWVILGVTSGATAAEINAAYKAAVRRDRGASVELNAAKEAGLAAADLN